MSRSVNVVTLVFVLLAAGLAAEEPARPDPLLSESLGMNPQQPRTVVPPGSYDLSIAGDFELGGFVFKDGYPFLHNDGGPSYFNTAVGLNALVSSTPGVPDASSGSSNTAVGHDALSENTTGSSNSALGAGALRFNTTGAGNTASGVLALFANTEGDNNTASGALALRFNTVGENNTASGSGALLLNTEGSDNTASGFDALLTNDTGSSNTATGSGALRTNTSGSYNTAIGARALYSNTDSRNVALGWAAGENNTTGSDNIFIGSSYFDSYPNTESNTVRIGKSTGTGYFQQDRAFISGIRDATLTGVEQDVCVDENDQVGPCSISSRRFKDQVRELGDASSKLLELRPVLFKYRPEVKEDYAVEQFGLIAEEVATVFPTLVSTDAEGRPFTVRYDLLTPLLLNELQKQHREVRFHRWALAVMFITGLALTVGRWRLG